jgi:hypothetical protein
MRIAALRHEHCTGGRSRFHEEHEGCQLLPVVARGTARCEAPMIGTMAADQLNVLRAVHAHAQLAWGSLLSIVIKVLHSSFLHYSYIMWVDYV